MLVHLYTAFPLQISTEADDAELKIKRLNIRIKALGTTMTVCTQELNGL